MSFFIERVFLQGVCAREYVAGEDISRENIGPLGKRCVEESITFSNVYNTRLSAQDDILPKKRHTSWKYNSSQNKIKL